MTPVLPFFSFVPQTSWTYLSSCLSDQLLNVGVNQDSILSSLFFLFLSFFFVFLGLPQWHMEVSRLGVKSELHLLAYTTAAAMWDLSCICNLHHSSSQCQILNPLIEANDRTRILMDTSQFCYLRATTGTPSLLFSYIIFVLVWFLLGFFSFPWTCYPPVTDELFINFSRWDWKTLPWSSSALSPLAYLGCVHTLLQFSLWKSSFFLQSLLLLSPSSSPQAFKPGT